MSSFSWLRAEDSTRYMNIASCNNVGFRLLVPKPFEQEFGTEIRSENYHICGFIMYNGVYYDIFGLLAKFNKDYLNKAAYPYKEVKGTSRNAQGALCDNETMLNRNIGVAISKDVRDALFLRYPLKLVSLSYEGTSYEKCEGFSIIDPKHGEVQSNWDDNKETVELHKKCKEFWSIRAEYEARLEKGLPPISKFEVRPGMPHSDLMEKAAQILNNKK